MPITSGLARRLLEHLVELVDDHLREVLAVHPRATIAGCR
jgi:hypothetical protein